MFQMTANTPLPPNPLLQAITVFVTHRRQSGMQQLPQKLSLSMLQLLPSPRAATAVDKRAAAAAKPACSNRGG